MCIIFHLAYYYFYDSFFNVPRKHTLCRRRDINTLSFLVCLLSRSVDWSSLYCGAHFDAYVSEWLLLLFTCAPFHVILYLCRIVGFLLFMFWWLREEHGNLQFSFIGIQWNFFEGLNIFWIFSNIKKGNCEFCRIL